LENLGTVIANFIREKYICEREVGLVMEMGSRIRVSIAFSGQFNSQAIQFTAICVIEMQMSNQESLSILNTFIQSNVIVLMLFI